MKYAAGLTVNSKSEISGPQWIKKIRSSEHVPDHFKKQLHWRKNCITTPVNFSFPKNVIKKPWLTDWLSAFYGDWETSTCQLEITVETPAEIVKRQEKSGATTGLKITVEVVPHLSATESIGRWHRLEQTWHKMVGKDAFHLTRGWTFPSSVAQGKGARTGVSLKSGRGIVLVATRLNLKSGKTSLKFQFQDSEKLEVFFHELACHAGRETQGLVDTHGNVTVDAWAADIERMFPKSTTFRKVVDTINRLAGRTAKTATTKTGMGPLGLHHPPAIDLGTLARNTSRRPGPMHA